MKCPVCSRPTRVIERDEHGVLVYITRQCTIPEGKWARGHGTRIFNTIETLAPVVLGQGKALLKLRTEAAFNQIKRKRRSLGLRESVRDNPNPSNSELARQLGVSEVTIRLIRKELQRDRERQ